MACSEVEAIKQRTYQSTAAAKSGDSLNSLFYSVEKFPPIRAAFGYGKKSHKEEDKYALFIYKHIFTKDTVAHGVEGKGTLQEIVRVRGHTVDWCTGQNLTNNPVAAIACRLKPSAG